MNNEIKSLDEHKVWNLVALPPGRIPIKGRWIYAVKSDGRKKARFVAKGFTQIQWLKKVSQCLHVFH